LITSDNQIVPPIQFIPNAEQIRLYHAVSRAIIQHTVNAMRGNGLQFSVNLAISDIADAHFRAYLFGILQERDIANRLTFEILETQSSNDEDDLMAFVQAVTHLGANIAIDDFGSGYANFERIARLRASFLKIDGSLIKNIDTDPTTRLVVETIVAFARKLGIETVAEYVHSEAVYQIVKELGIDYAQGFLLGKPHPQPSVGERATSI
jgi:EAL domain-containing protein (putative c-di-GMP-specific phosphodiesterase class I)